MNDEPLSGADRIAQAQARLKVAWNRAKAMGTGPVQEVAERLDAEFISAAWEERQVLKVERYCAIAVADVEGPWRDWRSSVAASIEEVGDVDPLGRSGTEVCAPIVADDELLVSRVDAGEVGKGEFATAAASIEARITATKGALIGFTAARNNQPAGSALPAVKQGEDVWAALRNGVSRMKAAATKVDGEVSPPIERRVSARLQKDVDSMEVYAQSPNEWTGDPCTELGWRAVQFERYCNEVSAPAAKRQMARGPVVAR